MTHVPLTKRIQHHGNVSSDLKDTQMTWSTFLRGPRHLGAKKMTMEFIFQHRFVKTRHILIIEYGKPNEPEEPPPNEKGEKPPTELYHFFTQIMRDLDVSVSKFNSLLTSHMRRNLRIESNPSTRSSLRGNYRKTLLEPRLSWANFIKGIDFLTIPSFDLEITLEFGGKRAKVTRHSVSVTVNDLDEMISEMEEEEFLTPPKDKEYHPPSNERKNETDQ